MKPFLTCFLVIFLIACGNTQTEIVQQSVEQAPIIYATAGAPQRSSNKEQLMTMPDREPPYMAKISVNFTPVYKQSTGEESFQLLRIGDQIEVIAIENNRTQIRTKDYEGWIENGRVEIAE